MDLVANKPWELDKMDRQGVAKFLTQYLDGSDVVRVLNINAPWGTGKTFFLKNWHQSEMENARACIYFNAWETDFSGDPFVSLVASIRDQLVSIIGPFQKAEDVIKEFTKRASRTLIAATPAITKGIIKKLTSIDIDIITNVIDKEDLANAAEKSIEKLINSNNEALRTVADFKEILSKLLQLASKAKAMEGTSKPVYIFIDELDRCRPTFAIELLERIKHLFGVPQCKFIIATDTLQLGEAVRAVYGSGFDSEKYLRRFFDREYSLTIKDYSSWITANCPVYDNAKLALINMAKHPIKAPAYKDPHYAKPHAHAQFSADNTMSEPHLIMLALANTFRPSLRDLEKISHHVDAIFKNSEDGRFHFFWAAYLSFLKIEAPNLYGKALQENEPASVDPIAEIFAPRYFYFRHTSQTVHSIFLMYLDLYKGGASYAQAKWASFGEKALPFHKNAALDFADHYSEMSKYPKLVDLAHSID